MNATRFLEKLLDGAEVEWVPLGAVTQYEQPTKYIVKSANYSDDHQTPVLTAGKSFILGYTDEADGIYEGSLSPVIIFDDFTTANKWADFDFKVKSSAMKMITSSDDTRFILRYVFHWLNTLPSGLVDGDHKRQWISNYCSKPIPIPCPDDPEKSLAIQGEIVRILDKFTELTAELTAELILRKKQYNYYRSQLLTFDEGEVEWKTLGNLTCIKTGQSVNKKMIAENPGQFPVINSGREPLGFLYDWNTQDDPIGITSRGTVGSVTWQEGRYFRGNLNYSVTIRSHDTLDVHYLYHVLEEYQPQIKELCTYDGIPALNAVNLKKLSIPVPSLVEQKHIAAVLNTFDTLTTSLTQGLPREIAIREKQYTWYRNQLLRFPKPDAEAA